MKTKIFKVLSLSLLLSTVIGIASSAYAISTYSNYNITSSVYKSRNYLYGKMVSNASSSSAGVDVDSETVNSNGTRLSYNRSFTYQNRFPAESSGSGDFSMGGYVENGWLLNGSWEYTRQSKVIGY